eukprot:TCALIF_13302-PA protein Name:"Protein of unknown function" AED:0.02 eAED:0.02 QI:588/1/0.5/1/1/1/2/0/183
MGNNSSSGNRHIAPGGIGSGGGGCSSGGAGTGGGGGGKKNIGVFRGNDFKSFDSIGEEAKEEETEPLSMNRTKQDASQSLWSQSPHQQLSTTVSKEGQNGIPEHTNGSSTSGSQPRPMRQGGGTRKGSIESPTASKTAPIPLMLEAMSLEGPPIKTKEIRKRALTLGSKEAALKVEMLSHVSN